MVLKNFEHFLLIYNRPPGSATASISRIGIIISIIKINLSIEGVHLVVNPSPYPSMLADLAGSFLLFEEITGR